MKCPKCSSAGAILLNEIQGRADVFCHTCNTVTSIPLLDSVFLSVMEDVEMEEINFQEAIGYCRYEAKRIRREDGNQEIAKDYEELADSLEKLIAETNELC